MDKSYKIFWSIIGISAVVLLVWQFAFPLDQRTKFARQIEEFFTEHFDRQIFTSDPLRGPLDGRTSNLTESGIFHWTNTQRQNNGEASLALNTQLNASATLKAQDMFDRQYFAHDSPTGEGVGDLVNSAGYEFVLIGENLALGNFSNDQALVQAWMDSPGHRDNILHSGYSEIGIGLVRGVFEGTETWMIVQHFGKPKSDCPEPSSALLAQIEANKAEMEQLEMRMEQKRAEMDAMHPKRGPSYNQKVREYNALVDRYNFLVDQTKQMVEIYNEQVQAFNECVQG